MAAGAGDRHPTSPEICTVFFGQSNFIARHLVAALLKSTRWSEIRIADPHSDRPDTTRSDRTVYIQTDPRARSLLRPAVDGAAAVFYVAPVSPPPEKKDFRELYELVVVGAKNVVAACRDAGVRRLVFTGSADVTSDGAHGINGGDDESNADPKKFGDVLNELLAQAEKIVLSANGKDGLLTCAMRPSSVFGPGDAYLVPYFVHEARSSRAKFVIGDGQNMCDFTYVENVAHANILAEEALLSDKASIAGKPVVITNNEPVKTWDFISSILEGLGYERPKIHVSVKFVLIVVSMLEWASEKFGLHGAFNPHLTAAMVRSLSCTRRFDPSGAHKLIGYSPIVSLEDGVKLTVKSFSHLAHELHNSSLRNHIRPSRADELLGNGNVAELLLWRDQRKTFVYVVAAFLLYYWFLLSGRTFISSSAMLFLLVAVILSVHSFLPSSMRFGLNINKLSSSYFHVSELAVKDVITCLAYLWNNGVCKIRLLAKGDDWNLLFKAIGWLYVVKLLVSFPLAALVGFGLVMLFSIFIVFEQYENEIMKLMEVVTIGMGKLQETLFARAQSFSMRYFNKS